MIVAVSALLIVAIVTGGIMLFGIKSEPQYVAHRGYSKFNPDNTAQSFNAATEIAAFYGIETDIRRTKDGYLVCSHDDVAVFNDGSKRKVEDSTYAELTEKPLENKRTSENAYVCLFSEYLSICKKGGKVAVVELKDVFTEDMVAQTLAEIDAYYAREKCTVIAFDYDSLLRVRAADPTMDLQYLSSRATDKNYGDCLEKGISIDVSHAACSRRLVKKFHAKGLKVNVWTVDDKVSQSRVRRYGVDFITSNVLYQD